MNDNLKSVVEKIIKKYYSDIPVEYVCALELYTYGIRESDLCDLQISDTQKIPIMNALRDIERK